MSIVSKADAAIVQAANKEDTRTDDNAVRFNAVSCTELARGDYRVNYLIQDILPEGMPCMIGGQLKTMKTMLSIDLAISLATGTDFLGCFPVMQAARVMYFIGEGGLAIAQDYARRVAASHGIDLADISGLAFCDQVPQLASLTELDGMASALADHEATVAILDPLYLALDGGRDSGNIMAMGPIFRNFNRVCAATGTTPLIIHHLRKNRTTANQLDPPELAELAWSGAAEFAASWVLLGRQEQYNPDDPGRHSLWLSCGGRAGHSSLHVLKIDEGRNSDDGGRHFAVDVQSARQARKGVVDRREAKKQAKREQQREEDRERVVTALGKYQEGETKTVLRDMAGLHSTRFNVALADLLNTGEATVCDVFKSNKKTPLAGYKLTE